MAWKLSSIIAITIFIVSSPQSHPTYRRFAMSQSDGKQPELTNLPDSSRPLMSDEPLRESTLSFKIRLNKTQMAKLKKAEGRGKSRTEVMKVALLKHLRNF